MAAEQARSPKAREYERLAAETREQAATYPEGDAVRAYLEASAAHWERRAREIQERANRRRSLREQRGRES